MLQNLVSNVLKPKPSLSRPSRVIFIVRSFLSDLFRKPLLLLREALSFVVVPFFFAMIALVFGYWPVALLLLGIAAFIAYFFRDPERVAPTETNVIVAPSDGRIIQTRVWRSAEARKAI